MDAKRDSRGRGKTKRVTRKEGTASDCCERGAKSIAWTNRGGRAWTLAEQEGCDVSIEFCPFCGAKLPG